MKNASSFVIHGIFCCKRNTKSLDKNLIAIFGGSGLLIYDYIPENGILKMKAGFKCKNEQILDCLIDNDQILIGFAHNRVNCYNFLTNKLIYSTVQEIRCLLYCMSIKKINNSFMMASGTIFNSMIIWDSKYPKTITNVSGHSGVIFHISFHSTLPLIATGSDDRTLCLWKYSFSSSEISTISIFRIFSSYGHDARLWDCQFGENCIISSSEDAACKIWDFEGKELTTIGGHVGKHIWKTDIKGNLIITGGNDSSIKLWDIKILLGLEGQSSTIPSLERLSELQLKEECVRGLIFSKNCNDLYMSLYSGYIWKFTLNLNKWQEVVVPGMIKTSGLYNFLVLTEDEKYLMTGDANGNIFLIDLMSNFKLTKIVVDNTRIMKIYKIDKILFVCTANSYIYEYDINCLSLLRKYSLPSSGFATYIVIYNEYKVIGDSKGNIHIFDVDMNIKTLKNVHKYTVSYLKVHNNELYSAGNNGKINHYLFQGDPLQVKIDFEVKTGPIVSVNKIIINDNRFLVSGFYESEFYLYDISNSTILFHIKAGGWKHPFAIMEEKSEKTVTFSLSYAGLKNQELFYYIQDIDINSICITLEPSFHGLQVNCVKIIEISNNTNIIITGSEDTMIRVHEHNKTNNTVTSVDAVQRHTSSITSISVNKLPEYKPICLTSGGKRQMNIFELNESHPYLRLLAYYPPSFAEELDQRILSSLLITIDSRNHLVLCGDSEGILQIYIFDNKNNIINPIGISKLGKPILSLENIKFNILIGTSEGRLCTIDLEKEINSYLEKKEEVKPYYTKQSLFSEIINVKGEMIHPMGINAMKITNINGFYILVSVGDDQGVSLTVFNSNGCSQIYREKLENISSSALRSVDINGSMIIVGGYDQKCLIFKFSDLENIVRLVSNGLGDSSLINKVCDYNSPISMIEDISFLNEYIYIVGSGMEILKD